MMGEGMSDQGMLWDYARSNVFGWCPNGLRVYFSLERNAESSGHRLARNALDGSALSNQQTSRYRPSSRRSLLPNTIPVGFDVSECAR
jgi:hypothetical protein